MEQFIQRENEIFAILERFVKEKLTFVVVGGYAVSTYKHRFSVDADIVIQEKDKEIFDNILRKEGFKEEQSRELEGIYISRFVRYVRKEFNISVDLLMNSVVSRQTGASFGFEFLFNNSTLKKIIGIEKEVETLVPRKEVLIAMKIHSGRLTDFRDIAALAKGSDIEKIETFSKRGDLKVVKRHLQELNRVVNDKNFRDSFKGVFLEKRFDIDFKQVEKISEMRI